MQLKESRWSYFGHGKYDTDHVRIYLAFCDGFKIKSRLLYEGGMKRVGGGGSDGRRYGVSGWGKVSEAA